MRTILSFFFIISISFLSCKKGNNPVNPGGGNPGGTNPGGGTTASGKITITGISPLKPYQGDVITLTGTGFDPDKTKDTVVIGAIMDIGAGPYFNLGGDLTHLVPNPKTTIVSATATEIKFRTDSTMEVYASYSQLFSIKVSAGPNSVYTGDTLHLKVVPKFLAETFTDPYLVTCFGTHSGDSLQLFGKGLYGPLTVMIDGKVIDYIRAVPENAFGYDGTSTAIGFIGIDFFGLGTPSGTCDQIITSKTITIINGDGRPCQLASKFFPGPNSQVLFVSIPLPSYEKSKTGAVPVVVTGYALRNFTLVLVGLDEADQTPFTETLGAYGGDQTGPITTSIDVGSLPTPKSSLGADYNVRVKDANDQIIGGVHFTLYP